MLGLMALALVTALLVAAAFLRSRTVPATPAAIPAPAALAPAASAPGGPAPSPAAPSPAASAPTGTVVVLGDGYAKGAAWVDELGDRVGRQVVNLSEDGMGYRAVPKSCASRPCTAFAGQATRVGAAAPDLVVVVGGEADGDNDLSTAAASTLSALKKAAPDATVVVLSPLSAQSPQPSWLGLHSRALQKAAEAAKATWLDVSSFAGRSSAYQGGDLSQATGGQLVSALAASVE